MMMRSIQRWSLIAAVGIGSGAAGCAANVDDGEQEGVETIEEGVKAATNETIDVGCLDLQDPNQNSRYASLGGTDTFLFEICSAPSLPRVGFHAYAWHKSFSVVMTDPNGNTYGPDPKYSAPDSPWAVAPAVQGQYVVKVSSKGNGPYVTTIVNDMFTP